MAKIAKKTKKTGASTVVKEAFDSLEGQKNAMAQGIVAVSGEVFTKDDTPPEPENLTEFQRGQKQVYLDLLRRLVIPPKSAHKPNPERDLASFELKLSKQQLDRLQQFFEIDVNDIVSDEVQRRFKDISP
jgi:hypothetical protein